MSDFNESMPVLKRLKGKSKGNSKAILRKRIDLDTTPAQKALEKDYNVLQGHLFRINYMSEIIANQNDTHDIVQETNAVVEDVLERSITHILKEQERLNTLIDQNGLDENDMEHDNPVSFHVEMSTPLAQKLINLYQQYDSLIKKSDFLYLNSLFESKQAQNLQYEYKRVVEKVGGRIRDLASKLNKAQHLATEESKKKPVPKHDDSVDKNQSEAKPEAPLLDSDKDNLKVDTVDVPTKIKKEDKKLAV